MKKTLNHVRLAPPGSPRPAARVWSAAWLGALALIASAAARAPGGPAGAGVPLPLERAETSIEKYLSKELGLNQVAAAVDSRQAAVAFRVETRDPDKLRGQVLASALAAHVLAPWAAEVMVVPHIHGIPLGVLTVPTQEIQLLSRGMLLPGKFLASWKSEVFPDLFAFGQPPTASEDRDAQGTGQPGAGEQDALLPPPPPPPPQEEAVEEPGEEAGPGGEIFPPPPPPQKPEVILKPPAERDYAAEVADPKGNDEEFASSLYRCILHCEPEQAELAAALERLKGDWARSQLITLLLVSKAYTDRKTTDEQFAQDLYQAVFAREPNRWEAKMMLDYLKSGGLRDVALTTLLSSTEYKELSVKRREAPAKPPEQPVEPAETKDLKTLYKECVDAYNQLLQLVASKPLTTETYPELRKAQAAYLAARKRYEKALKDSQE